jgi:hypothetical protein
MYACMHTQQYAMRLGYTHVRTHASTYARIRAHARMHARTHARMHALEHTHARTHTRAHARKRTHAPPTFLAHTLNTHADDTVRGGTLYHRYCAKLLQGWGGELGTFKNTPEGSKFLASLEAISIKSIRQVIRKLIDQGLDKECPDRMDDQQLLGVAAAHKHTGHHQGNQALSDHCKNHRKSGQGKLLTHPQCRVIRWFLPAYPATLFCQ